MAVGKAIDDPVKNDAIDQLRWEMPSQTFRGATDKVTEQGADPRSIGGLCEVKVGKEVQGLLTS